MHKLFTSITLLHRRKTTGCITPLLHALCLGGHAVNFLVLHDSMQNLLFLYLKLDFQHREQIRSRCLFASAPVPPVTSEVEFITESKTFFVSGVVVIFPFLLCVNNHHRKIACAEPHLNSKLVSSASMEITNHSNSPETHIYM